MAAAAAKLQDGVAWETDMLSRVVDHDLRIGVLERVLPGAPVLPPGSFPPAPGGLPLKPATLTRDDHPDHTRATVVAPPPASEVAPAPPSTVPQRSRKVASAASPDQTLVSEGMAPASASRTVLPDPVASRAAERLAELDDELGPEGRAAIRARIEAAEDERDRARARGEAPASLPTEGEADEEEHRDTFDDATRMIDRAKLPPLAPLSGRPHPPPRRIASARPTLTGAGVAPANTRTTNRIDVLFWSKLTLAAKAGAPAPHCEGPACNSALATCLCPCEACGRRRVLHAEATAEVTGPAVARELAERARETPTPTEPAGRLDARVRRRWAELVTEAQEAGKTVGHCHTERCMATGEGTDLCQCDCDACDHFLALLVKAESDVIGPASGK